MKNLIMLELLEIILGLAYNILGLEGEIYGLRKNQEAGK